MNDSRRTLLHSINALLIPLIAAAIIGVGGYIGIETMKNGRELIRVSTNQARVMVSLDNISAIVAANGDKLDVHLLEAGFISRNNSIRHHQKQGLSPCNGCHGGR